MQIPCAKECPGRSPTCHGVCDKYAAYAAYREAVRANRAKQAKDLRDRPGLMKILRRKVIREKQGRPK